MNAQWGTFTQQHGLSFNDTLNVAQASLQRRGYQIFKLETLKAQALQPFDKVRDLIADKVAGARTQTEMRKFLDRLRAQAIIEWKNDELKKAYEKQLAAADTTGLNP